MTLNDTEYLDQIGQIGIGVMFGARAYGASWWESVQGLLVVMGVGLVLVALRIAFRRWRALGGRR